MLSFEFFNARHGDAFLVRGGDSPSVMLVDGGPSGLYDAGFREQLIDRLPKDAKGVPRIDTVCLSHIDDDHAAGLLRLLIEVRRVRRDGLPDPLFIGRLWFNSVDELVEERDSGLAASVQPLFEATETVKASYGQGRAIRDEAAALGLEGNAPFGGQLTCGATRKVEGVDVTVVGPDDLALEKLAKRWRKAKKRADPQVITAAYTDGSIPNLSSIVLHLEHSGRTALLTGDARGDRILKGLEACGKATAGEPLHVSLLKLPHHGSDRNMKPEFFERVRADHYVISADGVKHRHPSEATLEALVASRAPNDEYTVHLTNDVPFATALLTSLRAGRAFDVAVRAEGDPVIEIQLD